jgi:hypothetical protein
MKIFLAYGYNARDQWVPELLVPIIRAFGDEPVTGEDLQGEQITEAVIENIKRSDALIAFATRRGDQPDATGKWPTHRWVTDELSQAISMRKRVVEIRETGVDSQHGIAGDRQYIEYDESRRDKCLVEIVKAIGKWHQGGVIKLQLLPEDFATQIFPYLDSPELRCSYCLYVGSDVTDPIQTRIIPITGGLFVQAAGVPRNAFIQVKVQYRDKAWTSSFESTESLGIRMQKIGS